MKQSVGPSLGNSGSRTNVKTKEAIREWTKQLGHKPTAEDWARAFYAPAARRAAKEHMREMTVQGKKDGHAWAESGRSYNAVAAVYNYATSDAEDESEERNRLEAAMMAEVGDDDECPLFGFGEIDADYADAWFCGERRDPTHRTNHGQSPSPCQTD